LFSSWFACGGNYFDFHADRVSSAAAAGLTGHGLRCFSSAMAHVSRGAPDSPRQLSDKSLAAASLRLLAERSRQRFPPPKIKGRRILAKCAAHPNEEAQLGLTIGHPLCLVVYR
jgi:hypothetical protein